MSIIQDTHGLIVGLQNKGFDDQQAEGIADALNSIDLSTLATKHDLERMELRLTIRIGGMLAIAVAVLSLLKLYG